MHISRAIRRTSIIIAAVVAAVTLAACGSADTIRTVDAAAFNEQTRTAGVTIIDVRSPNEFASGHIMNAINIDVEGGNFDAGIADLDPAKTYAVYCHSGRRSRIAANTMADAGFTSISNLDGGIIAWQNAGYPLVVA